MRGKEYPNIEKKNHQIDDPISNNKVRRNAPINNSSFEILYLFFQNIPLKNPIKPIKNTLPILELFVINVDSYIYPIIKKIKSANDKYTISLIYYTFIITIST